MPLASYVEMAESAVLALVLNKSKKTARPFVSKVMNVGFVYDLRLVFSRFSHFFHFSYKG